jgi:cytochrome c-type biogenesis protein CcmH
MRRLCGTVVAILLLSAIGAQAVEPDEVLTDPGLEARARMLSGELRCLVCQNQSIDESDAPLAKDLRLLIRERLKAGASDAQVRDFMVARYGDFVLLRPRLRAETLLLWVTPFALLLAGLFFAIRTGGRGTAAAGAEAPLSEEERGKVAELGLETAERKAAGK